MKRAELTFLPLLQDKNRFPLGECFNYILETERSALLFCLINLYYLQIFIDLCKRTLHDIRWNIGYTRSTFLE